MKVICTQENLKSGLMTVGKIISPSNTLPILNNVLIKTENGQLKISSTNLEVAVNTIIRCKTEEEGGVTVLARTISDLVNNLPNKNIQLETENGIIKIETENYHTSLKTLPAEEFPLIPTIETNETLGIDAKELKKALDQVSFSASTNQTQPEISGILFSVEKDILKITATDRYRLAEKKVKLQKKVEIHQEVIVPHKTIMELSRIAGAHQGNIEIVINETQILFQIDQTQIISRLIDGQYPPYQEIIPNEFPTTVITDRQQLINALKAGGIFSQNSNSIEISFNPESGNLRVTSESQDLGKSEAVLPSDIQGRDGSLILNYRYVLDSLSTIEAEHVVLKIIDENAPAIIVPQGQDDYLYLVMPIKS